MAPTFAVRRPPPTPPRDYCRSGAFLVVAVLLLVFYHSDFSRHGANRVTQLDDLPAVVSVSRLFSNGMVLQAGGDGAAIWGRGPPGATVDVVLQRAGGAGSVVSSTWSTVDAYGIWTARLDAVSAGTAQQRYELLVSSGRSAVVKFEDVIFGHVLLCSGQSNMEFGIIASLGGDAEVAEAATGAWDHMRLFSVDQRTNSSVPLLDFHSTELVWARPSQPGSLDGGAARSAYGPFSAGAYGAVDGANALILGRLIDAV